jgi:hypothetical protein
MGAGVLVCDGSGDETAESPLGAGVGAVELRNPTLPTTQAMLATYTRSGLTVGSGTRITEGAPVLFMLPTDAPDGSGVGSGVGGAVVAAGTAKHCACCRARVLAVNLGFERTFCRFEFHFALPFETAAARWL